MQSGFYPGEKSDFHACQSHTKPNVTQEEKINEPGLPAGLQHDYTNSKEAASGDDCLFVLCYSLYNQDTKFRSRRNDLDIANAGWY